MKQLSLVLASIAWIALSSHTARAEGFVDLRVGGAFTENGDVDISAGPLSVGFETEYEDSVTGGVRGGYWFEPLPWLGLAADVTYFGPDDDTAGGPELDVIPISPLLMARVPIAKSEEYPYGQVQPFLGIGPGIFISLVDFDPGDDESVDVGVDLHAGVNVQLTRMVSVFAEYRYTYFEPEFEIQGVDIEPELSTHHAAVGVGFHF